MAGQQTAGSEEETGVIDTHQLHALCGGLAQEWPVNWREGLGRAGTSPPEHDQVVVVGQRDLLRTGLHLNGRPATGNHVPVLEAENRPAAVALPAVIFVVASEAQLVQEATEWQQAEFGKGQQEEANIRLAGVCVHEGMSRNC
jgi:hypothetical protein